MNVGDARNAGTTKFVFAASFYIKSQVLTTFFSIVPLSQVKSKQCCGGTKKLTCNRDSTVLLSPSNNTMTCGKIIIRVIPLLARDSKKCYPRYIKVSLVEEGLSAPRPTLKVTTCHLVHELAILSHTLLCFPLIYNLCKGETRNFSTCGLV